MVQRNLSTSSEPSAACHSHKPGPECYKPISWQRDHDDCQLMFPLIGKVCLPVIISLGNSGLCWTVFAWNRDTVVPAEGNGDLQTLICVLVARPRRCVTLLNPVPWQSWMAAYLGCTLWMRTLFRGWPIMVNDTHTRRRRRLSQLHTSYMHC